MITQQERILITVMCYEAIRGYYSDIIYQLNIIAVYLNEKVELFWNRMREETISQRKIKLGIDFKFLIFCPYIYIE